MAESLMGFRERILAAKDEPTIAYLMHQVYQGTDMPERARKRCKAAATRRRAELNKSNNPS